MRCRGWGRRCDDTRAPTARRLPTRRIAYATVQTLLRRLEAKGYLAHEVESKAHVFAAAVKREEVIKRRVRDFVHRLFGADPVLLMAHLADQLGLEADEVGGLRRKMGKNPY